VAMTETKAVSLAGSPDHQALQRFARSDRAWDRRGDRYDHSLAFDPRTEFSPPARKRKVGSGTPSPRWPISPRRTRLASDPSPS
jgi:hypothetical protein